jgi:ribosomal-protein-alanine N-acetyltransferase
LIRVGDYIVRNATPNDMRAVIDINLRTLPENYTTEFFYIHLRDYPDLFYVAELNGSIVGYIMCRLEYGISDFSKRIPKPAKKGHVISIAVLPEHRRRGLGRMLMKMSIESMIKRGADEVYLEVRVTNEPAITLYKSLGFIIVRRIHSYYSDGEDAYVMSLNLKNLSS